MFSKIEKIVLLFFIPYLGSKQPTETDFHESCLDNRATSGKLEIWSI
jgi:hypothetical protein